MKSSLSRPDPDFPAFVSEQLAAIPALKSRPMFGAHGLYSGDTFFGIVWRGSLYFRTSPSTVADYDAANASWFQPNPQQALKTYREVPASVLARPASLLAWAQRAIAC
ncbi:MAG: TfoX/Sxy family protein [Verrucomicrobia bacterium]|nr:TfoX/Sxy family protein [Verrucomicrobiota bacterium]